MKIDIGYINIILHGVSHLLDLFFALILTLVLVYRGLYVFATPAQHFRQIHTYAAEIYIIHGVMCSVAFAWCTDLTPICVGTS